MTERRHTVIGRAARALRNLHKPVRKSSDLRAADGPIDFAAARSWGPRKSAAAGDLRAAAATSGWADSNRRPLDPQSRRARTQPLTLHAVPASGFLRAALALRIGYRLLDRALSLVVSVTWYLLCMPAAIAAGRRAGIVTTDLMGPVEGLAPMLVTERHLMEDLRLVLADGREVRITPVAVGRRSVRLGISAPDGVEIHRVHGAAGAAISRITSRAGRPERAPAPVPPAVTPVALSAYSDYFAGSKPAPVPPAVTPVAPAPGAGPGSPMAAPPATAGSRRWICGRMVDVIAAIALIVALPALIAVAPLLAAHGRDAGVVR